MKTTSFIPELLSPAGSIDKLKASVAYGADAVYLAGLKYGLRSAADNFTLDELAEGVAFAHERQAKVYVVLNSFPHDSDMQGLAGFVRDIEALGVDGVIASDLGVITVVSRESRLPIHLSTQASCLNVESGLLYKKMGVTRLILGREVSIRDAGKIKRATGLEVELFIHGSMCMAYSGNCTISNFTKGRDSNRGGCAQSCRFSYSLQYPNGENQPNRFWMSAKDLMGLDLLPEFFEEQIDSVKIEGRMRSALYAGMISKIHREAIDAFVAEGRLSVEKQAIWNEELRKIPHRQYASGSLDQPADQGTTLSQGKFDDQLHYDFLGSVRKVESGRYVLVEVKEPFKEGESIELLPFEGPALCFEARGLTNAVGSAISQAKGSTLVRLPYFEQAAVGQLVRKVSAL